MGYKDEFYVASNIIGYTGSLDDKPTVYFMSSGAYGRITQAHKNLDNIGRERVRSKTGYTFANEEVVRNGMTRIVMVERMNGVVQHTSRNRFILVAPGDGLTRSLLARVIDDFPDKKSMYK